MGEIQINPNASFTHPLSSLNIGYWNNYDGYSEGQYTWTFNGMIDNMRIYNRTLTDTEIQDLYEEGFTPVELLSNLISRVVALNLQNGISNALDAKLDTAISAISDMNDNNNVAAVNSLNAFINSVEAQKGNKITIEDADMLIASANKIITKLTAQ